MGESMHSKFILQIVLTVALGAGALVAQAQPLTILNELGAPKAGGLPREQSSAYEILYGSVRVGTEVQRVIVTNPPGAGPKPALFFIVGMGCYSLDFSGTGPKAEAYQRILDFVTKLGFVTMRVEKTGMGDSVGTPCADQDFKREVAGNLAGLKALASYSFVKADQIYIFGHSIGGVIAPLLAAEVPVKAIATLGSLATDWYSYDLSNSRRQYALSGMGPTQIENAIAWQDVFATEFYLNRKTPAQIISERPQLAGYFQLAAHWTYMQQLADANPVADWNRSDADVLIFSGTTDFIGSQGEELQQMIAEANKTRSNPIRFSSISFMDHFFRSAESQEASFKNISMLGLPLYFKESFLTDLKTQFLGL
jgi:pimeloyl-ACP methyl ester carboxylesterase